MPDSWPKSALRGLFRWYLSKFPLRDGKAYFYERLHAGLHAWRTAMSWSAWTRASA